MTHFFVNALHAFHRFNRRYHVKKNKRIIINLTYTNIETDMEIFHLLPKDQNGTNEVNIMNSSH